MPPRYGIKGISLQSLSVRKERERLSRMRYLIMGQRKEGGRTQEADVDLDGF